MHLSRLVVLASALSAVAPTSVLAQERGSLLTVERIFVRREFAGRPMPEVHWLKDGASYLETRRTQGGGGEIARVDAVSGTSTVLADSSVLVLDGKPLVVEDVILSSDESQALLFHSSVRVWRQNTRGLYHVLDFRSKKLTPLSAGPGLQMFAKFAPDGRQVAFVRDNNLFVVDLASGQERQLTSDGSENIINGTTDWVYEEELDLRDAFRWSPDSKRIAYWRFDQSAVPTFPLVDELHVYPKVLPLRYPKAGERNSAVRVGVLDLGSGKTTWLEVGADTGVYLARMDWVDRDTVVIQRLPRRQNRIDVLLASATSGRSRVLLSERDSAWVDVSDQPIWLAGGKMFVWPSERSGWRQLYLYNRDGKVVRRLTKDGIDVTALAGVDSARGIVYTVEATPTPMERQVFSYNALRNAERNQVTRGAGTHRVDIGPNARYMVDVYGSAATPRGAALVDLRERKQVRVMVDNAELKAKVAALGVRPAEFFKIPLASGETLNARRIVPADFDSTRKYPVLVQVYGGPGSQMVTDDWGGVSWSQLLAQRGIIVVNVDNRGTGGRGRAFRKLSYLHLGRYETEDQVAAAKWLASRPWVDGGRIGIWGWSYGGYLSLLAAAAGGNAYKAAIAVAPVTDWRLYDTIYTERYMWVPQENAAGYKESAPLTHVGGITSNLLVVHGTGDDNVHEQNTIQLADKLQAAGKQFQLMLYPNRTHAISGGNTSAHLYEMLTRFVETHLGDGSTRTAQNP